MDARWLPLKGMHCITDIVRSCTRGATNAPPVRLSSETMSRDHGAPIAISQAAGPVLIARKRDGAWQASELTPAGWSPAWSGNGEIAVSHVEAGAAETVSTLELIDIADPALPSSVVARTSPAALIAPRTAHYVLWRDDGHELCYVAPADGTLALYAFTPGAAAGPRRIFLGAPLFPAWQPGQPRLAVHHGSALTLLDTESGASLPVSERAAGFRTPA